MPIIGGAAIAGGSVLGGILGGSAQSKAQAQAMALAQQAAAQYNGIIPPEVKALIIEQLKSQGLYTPETETAIDAGQSAFQQVKENPELVKAQTAALQQMAGVSRTGFQASDRAALNQVRNKVNTNTQGQLASIQQQMQARGMSGSGSELAQQLAAAQSGSNQASEQADTLAAQAQQNALKAISDSSNMASNARNSDFQVASAKAAAADQMNRFNVTNKQSVQNANVNNRNTAQQENLQNNQRIADTNTANNNAELQRQETAKQQLFQNQLAKASGTANALNGVANQAKAGGQQAANAAQGIGTGVGQIAGAIANGVSKSGSTSTLDGTSVTDEGYGGDLYAWGGKVPGQASVPGNSFANDTVPATLSPGEVVVPRDKVSNPKAAADFVAKAAKGPAGPKMPKAPAAPKADGPSDGEIAQHLIDNGSALHSLLKRIHSKKV